MNDRRNDHLHVLRDFELELALANFPRSGRVVDLGAGTGRQAAELTRRGYEVLALDLPSSAYAHERVHPVTDYDGRTLPIPSHSVDAVFSSNVLEHVRDVGALLAEIARVLAPGGVAIHVLPTPAWRWWTTASHYGWLAKRIGARLARTKPKGRSRPAGGTRASMLAATLFPLRHGERGMTLTEPYFFSLRWWAATFSAHGFEVIKTYPTGLFYTGGMVFAGRLSLASRKTLARWLGSACRVYVTRHTGRQIAARAVEPRGAAAQ